ncbi:MAG: PRC-barrel domain-containing protein [Firmicutes bacterium]|nr:PRC-barrel domain-containing protein [Bacillota bacterium]
MERRRRSEVVGLPVLTLEDARLVGRVADILIGQGGARVVGLLLDGGGIWRGRGIVPYEEVVEIGPAAVLVRAGVVLRAGRERQERLEAMLRRHRSALGTRLVDERGRDQGTIDDIVFSPADGRVLGYSVSLGFIRDILDGQGFLPVDGRLVWSGGEVAILRTPDGDTSDGPRGGGGDAPHGAAGAARAGQHG